MKITDIKTFPLKAARDIFVVKVETDEGIFGWGESGLSGREKAVVGVIEHYAEFLRGRDPFRIGVLWQEMYRSQYFEGGDVEQVLCRVGQQAEAIDHFHLQLIQLLGRFGTRDALVQHQAGMHIRYVTVREQGRNQQLDRRTLVQRLVECRGAALLECPDGAFQQVVIH